MPLVLKWRGYRKFRVNCILEIHVILRFSGICLRFSIYQDFVCIRNLNMLEFYKGILEESLISLGF